MTIQNFVLRGALALGLAAGAAAAVLAQAGTGAGESPVDHGENIEGMDHGQMSEGMDHGGAMAETSAPDSGAVEAYRAANMAMHEAMDIEFTGDSDIDFARGMIAHHQGAIDMARVVLEHGKDPDLRQLAEEVVKAQEAEITFLRNWLAENDK